MAYRYDPDLEFLGTLKSEEMNDLVYLLTHDKDGESRFTETLTVSEEYKRYYPEHHQYWKKIAEEIQCFGGNTVANIFRSLFSDGSGVLYKEILCDVCDKMKVNYNKNSSTKKIEENLLMKILEDALENMSSDEIKKLAMEIGLDNTDSITAQGISATFIAVFKLGGFKSYQLTVIVVNAILKVLIGRGLTLAGNVALTRAAAILTGPIGWAVTALWTIADVAGPAYRVTIPAVIQIAYLRSLSENRDAIEMAKKMTL